MIKRVTPLVILAGILLMTMSLHGQPQDEIETILSDIKNYRFSAVSIYRMNRMEARKVRQVLEDGNNPAPILPEETKDLDQTTLRLIRLASRRYKNFHDIARHVQRLGVELSPQVGAAIRYFMEQDTAPRRKIDDVYIITTRAARGEKPQVIAMIVVRGATGDLSKDLRSVPPADIYTPKELKAIKMDRG